MYDGLAFPFCLLHGSGSNSLKIRLEFTGVTVEALTVSTNEVASPRGYVLPQTINTTLYAWHLKLCSNFQGIIKFDVDLTNKIQGPKHISNVKNEF